MSEYVSNLTVDMTDIMYIPAMYVHIVPERLLYDAELSVLATAELIVV